MWKPHIPADEEDRLKELRELGILLTTPEEPLDNVTKQLAEIFGVPGAFISFIDEDTQYYKSEVGLPAEFAETRMEPRDISLCSHVVGTNESLVVEDLAADPRFQESPAVHRFGLRFYAGAPLRGEGGYGVGSLCIVDSRPRTISLREQQMLDLLAEGVMAHVRLQVASRRLVERSLEIDRDLQQAMSVQRFLLPAAHVEGEGWRIEHVYRPMEHLGGDFLDVHRRQDGGWAVLIADVSGHGTTAALTTAMTKAAFVRAADAARSPGPVLQAMNRELARVAPPSQMITAQAVFLDPRSGRATVASAGHPYPILARGSETVTLDLEQGPPLLVDEATEYRDVVLDEIDAGNSIVLYTDGAIETGESPQRHLGIEGLRAKVHSLRGGGTVPLQELVAALLEHAEGSLTDDVALMSIGRCAK
jgi:serine phosphatase RsbU (regulator of sigma subunit)